MSFSPKTLTEFAKRGALAAVFAVSYLFVWQVLLSFNLVWTPDVPWLIIFIIPIVGSFVLVASNLFDIRFGDVSRPSFWISVAIGVVGLISAVLVWFPALKISGKALYAVNAPGDSQLFQNTFILCTALCAGIVEELIFRGLIQGYVGRYFSRHIAVIVATVLFVVAHLIDHDFGYDIVPIVIVSLVLGYITEIARSIGPAIVLHSALDLFTFYMSRYVGTFSHSRIDASEAWMIATLGLGFGIGFFYLVRRANVRPPNRKSAIRAD